MTSGRQTVLMVTTSYPRFEGDTVGTFLEPIARGVAALGHTVHVVAPWHPLIRRPSDVDDAGVTLHFFRYAPVPQLNVFGYAGSLKADVGLRASALLVSPLAVAAAWATTRRVARLSRATVVHAHWVVPGGVIAAAAVPRLPCILSLHGSDMYVAERLAPARVTARAVFRHAVWTTACSEDLRQRAVALGAPADRTEVLAYGVDVARFRRNPTAAAAAHARLGLDPAEPVIVALGRLVRKKGFEYLLDAVARLGVRWPRLQVVVAGDGDLAQELRQRAHDRGLAERARFPGVVNQDDVPGLLAAADLVVVPSVRDDRGNVDGLPNVVLEALAVGAAVISTPAGGITSVARDGVTAAIVPERDVEALAARIDELLRDPERRRSLGHAARELMRRECTWERYAARLDEIYAQARQGTAS